MLLAVLVVGVITFWFYGTRPGLWAAAGTAIACAAALVMPRYAIPIYVVLAVAVVAVIFLGSRRPRPTKTVIASRWVMSRARSIYSRFAGSSEEKR
jgi:hypothetical protein